MVEIKMVKTDNFQYFSITGPDLEGGSTRARASPPPPDGSQVNYFVDPCITFLPIFLCPGHKTKEKAYL